MAKRRKVAKEKEKEEKVMQFEPQTRRKHVSSWLSKLLPRLSCGFGRNVPALDFPACPRTNHYGRNMARQGQICAHR